MLKLKFGLNMKLQKISDPSLWLHVAHAANSASIGAAKRSQIPLIPEKLPNLIDIGWQFSKLVALKNRYEI